MNLDISVSQRVFIRAQYGIASVLVVLALGFYLIEYVFHTNIITHILGVFDVGREDSIITWFSSFNLFISSMLLILIHVEARKTGQDIHWYWLILGLLFLAFSIDEVALIHERANRLQQYTGVPFAIIETHSWLLYAAIFVIFVFLFFIPFLNKIPRRTAVQFLLAGSIFLAGAVGFEFMGAVMLYTDFAERSDLIYKLRRVLEEGCEMYGIVIFNCALLREIALRNISLTIRTDRV